MIPQPPSAVFIDAGGVLLLPDLELIRDLFGLPSSTDLHLPFYRAFARHDPQRVEHEWLWEAFAVEVGLDPSDAAEPLKKLVSDEIDPWQTDAQLAPHVDQFLRTLHAAHIPTVIVSNSRGYIAEKLRAIGACQVGDGPLPVVDGIIDSHIVGVRKPDPQIFHFAREVVESRTGKPLNFADGVHIGDTAWSDVVAANRAGIPVVHLDPASICLDQSDHAHAQTLLDVLDVIGVDRG